MSYVLILFSLLLLYLYTLQINNDFANPGFLYLSIWCVSTVFSLIFLRGEDISFLTTIIILAGNACFSYSVYISGRVIKNNDSVFRDSTYLSRFFLILLYFTLFYAYKFVYADLKSISILIEPSSEFNKVLEGARYVATHSIARMTYISSTIIRVNYALGIVLFYYYCKQKFYPVNKSATSIELFCVSIFSLFGGLLSTGRSELLGMVMGYLTIFLIFYSKKYAWENSKFRMKLIKYLFRAAIFFVGSFLFVGIFLLNRTGAKKGETLIINLAKYMGSSIGALDYYLHNIEQYPKNTVFGQNIFLAVYSTLSSLGLYNGERVVFLPNVVIQGTITNVYTVYYYLIQDFGILLAIIFQSIYGLIFGTFYYLIKRRFFNKYIIIMFAMLSQAIVMSFFAEQLFSTITNHISRMVFAFAFLLIIDIISSIRLKI